MSALPVRLAPAPAVHVGPWRACELCSHSTSTLAGGLGCWRLSTGGHGTPVPVQVARSRDGICGPNAVHMHAPGIVS